jgi:ceramide glucosyltransferase
MHAVLYWLAIVGTVTSTIFCGLVVVAAMRFARRRSAASKLPPTFTPPVSLLKPLHGSEPGLELSIESFFQQNYPAPYEILFCARREDDAGLQLARKVAARYPSQAVQFIACGEPQYPNPKMYSLGIMSEAATYPHFVTSDADARVAPDYLLRCVQALAPGYTVKGKPLALSSCLYVGQTDPDSSFFTQLDAAGKSVEMGAGVLVADMLSGTDFALGVTMVLRREAFLQAGGYADLGNYWAEDFVLGHRLAEQGRGVEMSTHVIRLVVAEQGIKRSFRDQLRWMQSTRRSRPLGHLGTGLTFAMPFGILGFVAQAAVGHWASAAAFLAIAVLNRMVEAAAMLYALGASNIAYQTAIYPLRDLLGFIVWCCSYLPADTRYHGTSFTIMPDGRLIAGPESAVD